MSFLCACACWSLCVCLSKVEELEKGTPGRLKVTAKSTESDEMFEGEFNTVSCLIALFYCPS